MGPDKQVFSLGRASAWEKPATTRRARARAPPRDVATRGNVSGARAPKDERAAASGRDLARTVVAPTTARVRAVRKPVWNDRQVPTWEEMERKNSMLRRQARERIMAKRKAKAAAQAKAVRLSRLQQGVRVICRARRDCLIADARGGHPPDLLHVAQEAEGTDLLGKRTLATFQSYEREAALKMLLLLTSEVTERAPKWARVALDSGIPRYHKVENSSAAPEPSDSTAPGEAPQTDMPMPLTARAAAGKPATTTTAARKPRKPGRAPLKPLSVNGGIGSSGKGALVMKSDVTKPRVPTARRAWTSDLRSFQAADANNPCPAGGATRSRARAGRPTPSAQAKSASTAGTGSSRSAGGAGSSVGSDKGRAAAAGAGTSVDGDVARLQEQVALLKAAAGLSDSDIAWKLETAKPGANACQIATEALDRAETAYERLLWQQGQLQRAVSRLTGRGSACEEACALFARKMDQALWATKDALGSGGGGAGGRGGGGGGAARSPGHLLKALAGLKSACEAMVEVVQYGPLDGEGRGGRSGRGGGGGGGGSAQFPADEAAKALCEAARRLVCLSETVDAGVRIGATRDQVDVGAVARGVQSEHERLQEQAKAIERELRALGPRLDKALSAVEMWRQRRTDAPEFPAERAAAEELWAEAQRPANQAALAEMRKLLPEAVWEMSAVQIQAAAGAGAGVPGGGRREGVFYPAGLALRLKACRPLHWLVMAPEDVAAANFLQGEGAAAFTQLEVLDLTELRALFCVLPNAFHPDKDGKKAAWRERLLEHIQSLVQQEEGGSVAAGWDPILRRRGAAKLPPLRESQRRNPEYSYDEERSRSQAAKMRAQERRLGERQARLAALWGEVAAAKRDVAAACDDARSEELRKQFGLATLRKAREQAKAVHDALVREEKDLTASVRATEEALRKAYPSAAQLEEEADKIHQLSASSADTVAGGAGNHGPVVVAAGAAGRAGSGTGAGAGRAPVPGAFSEAKNLVRRSGASERKLSPEEEKRLRADEVRRVFRDRAAAVTAAAAATTAEAGLGPVPGGGHVADSGSSDGSNIFPRGPGTEHPESPSVAATGSEGSDATHTGSHGGDPAASRAQDLPPTDGNRPGPLRGAHPGSFKVGSGKTASTGRGRRRMMVAPAVLEFLNRDLSARASSATTARPPPPAPPAAAAAMAGVGTGAGAGVGAAPGGAEAAAAGDGRRDGLGRTDPAPQSAAAATAWGARPTSRALMALLQASGSAGGGGVASRCGEVTEAAAGGSGAAPAGRAAGGGGLNFLAELKAKAAGREGDGAGLGAPAQGPGGVAVAARLPRAAAGGSFLEELHGKVSVKD